MRGRERKREIATAVCKGDTSFLKKNCAHAHYTHLCLQCVRAQMFFAVCCSVLQCVFCTCAHCNTVYMYLSLQCISIYRDECHLWIPNELFCMMSCGYPVCVRGRVRQCARARIFVMALDEIYPTPFPSPPCLPSLEVHLQKRSTSPFLYTGLFTSHRTPLFSPLRRTLVLHVLRTDERGRGRVGGV